MMDDILTPLVTISHGTHLSSSNVHLLPPLFLPQLFFPAAIREPISLLLASPPILQEASSCRLQLAPRPSNFSLLPSNQAAASHHLSPINLLPHCKHHDKLTLFPKIKSKHQHSCAARCSLGSCCCTMAPHVCAWAADVACSGACAALPAPPSLSPLHRAHSCSSPCLLPSLCCLQGTLPALALARLQARMLHA